MTRKWAVAGAIVLTASWAIETPAQQILKKEPARGALSVGAVVLVDDGTCPRGQIKEVTGGNDTRGIMRQSKCIARPK